MSLPWSLRRRLVGRELRRRAGSYLAIGMVLALGGGAAIGTANLAARTDRAYDEFVARAQVSDLVLNPSLVTEEIDREIRGLDGVDAVSTGAMMLVSFDPTPLAVSARDLVAFDLLAFGSTDGRYTTMDRPIVSEGRLPTGEREMLLTRDARDWFASEYGRAPALGERIDVSFWTPFTDEAQDPDGFVRPIRTETLTVVGLGRMADEVLPDQLFPRRRLLVSDDVARRYDCAPSFRAGMTEAEVNAAISLDCATVYRYYAMQLDEGTVAASVVRQFVERGGVAMQDVPQYVVDQGGSYFPITTERSDLDIQVRRAIRPTVTALWTFAIVAAAVSVLLLLLLALRVTARADDDAVILSALGLTARDLATRLGVALAVAATAGLGAAVLVATAISPLAPVGLVRAVEPSSVWRLHTDVVVIGLVAAVVVMGVVIALVVRRRATRGEPAPSDAPAVPAVVATLRNGPPARWLGVSAAMSTQGRSSAPALLVSAVVAVVGVTAMSIFAVNVRSLLDNPDRFGWPWDAGALVRYGYGGMSQEGLERLADRPEVVGASRWGIDSAARLDGSAVPTIFGDPDRRGFPFGLLSGRRPERPGELAVGAATARVLDLELGDEVDVDVSALSGGRRVSIDAEVVAIMAMPVLGSYEAGRTGLGTGAAVVADTELLDETATFVGIDLVPGTNAAAFVDAAVTSDLDAESYEPFRYPDVVRPAEIEDADGPLVVPAMLAGLVTVALSVGLATSMAVSVRERRRELSVLRALGFTRRDLGSTVRWHSLATIAVGLAIGVPLGIAAGRLSWMRYASSLGVPQSTERPWWVIASIVAGGTVLALGAAAWPAWRVRRLPPVGESRVA